MPVRSVSAPLLRTLGTVVAVANIAVAALSLSDLYLLASGAVTVRIPTEKDFLWRFDPDRRALVITGSFSVVNRGFYDITDLSIAATVSTAGGVALIRYGTKDITIPAGGGGNRTIVALLPVANLLALDYGTLLFCATYFRIGVRIGALYVMGMARFSADERIDYPWTPPLAGLRELFYGGGLRTKVTDALPAAADMFNSINEWAASAVLAGGEPVSFRKGTREVVFRYEDGTLDIQAFALLPSPVSIGRLSLPLSLSGGGRAYVAG